MTRRYLSLALLLVAPPALSIPPSWLPANISGVKAAVAEQGTAIDLLRTSVVNVKSCVAGQMFCASGSAQATTGSITAGSTSLAVASAIDFAVGQGISVAQAGAAGALLVAKITAISGTTITLDTAAGTTASAKAVQHDDTVAIQAAITSMGSSGNLELCGYFRTYTTLTFPAGSFTVKGCGSDSTATYGTIIDSGNISAVVPSITFTACNGCRLSDFTLKNAKYWGVYVGGSYGFDFENIYILGGSYAGITTNNGSGYFTFRNVNINLVGGYKAMLVNGTNHVKFINCSFGNPGQANSESLKITGSKYVTFSGGQIDESFLSGSNAIGIYNSSHVLFENMHVYNGVQYGIYADASSSYVTLRDVMVESFSSNPTWMINLNGTKHVLDNVTTVSALGRTHDINLASTGHAVRNVNPCAVATPGNATCDGTPGTVTIAAGAATITVTNQLVSAATRITAQLQAADAGCTGIASVVPGAGSVAINTNAACTGNTAVAFVLQ